MQASCKFYMIAFFFFIIVLPMSFSLEECSRTTTVDQIPCLVYLQINTSSTACSAINFSLYLQNESVYSQLMEKQNNFTCSANFTQTTLGQYTHYFSTGDSGSINLVEGNKMIYLIYFIFAALVGLVILAYYTDDYFYHTFVSFLIMIFGVYILAQGFNGLVNTLTNTIGVMFVALGFYFMIPSMQSAIDALNYGG